MGVMSDKRKHEQHDGCTCVAGLEYPFGAPELTHSFFMG